MIQFSTLGNLDLRGSDGREIRPILAQPKRLALLAYLAVAQPRGFHRRDELLGLFWPEQDARHARAALNRAIHYLRRSLGERVIVSRGDAELGLDPFSYTCDAVRFEAAVLANRHDEALALYRGDFLAGFFLSGTSGFEHWLEAERARLKALAVRAAWGLSEAEEAAGHVANARLRGQLAVDLAPYDEAGFRRYLSLLDRTGDRAGAVQAFEDFARRIAHELDVLPAPETQALVEGIRARTAANGSADRTSVLVNAPADVHASSTPVAPSRNHGDARFLPGRALVLLTGGILIALAVGTALRAFRAPAARRVVVAPFVNRTGKPSLDPLGPMAAERITQSLVQLVPNGVRTGTRPRAAGGRRTTDEATELEALARRARAGTVVAGAFYADGDTVLRFSAQIVDVLHHNVVWVIPPVVVPVGSEVRALEELTQRATGAVAALLDPRFSSWFHSATAPPRFDAFQEFVRGVDLQIRTDAKRALVHYNRAIMLDSTFTWARMQAAVAHMNEFQNAIADSIMDVVDRMRDRVTPLQRHWLDWMLATRKEDWVEAYRAMQKAATLAPERFLYSLGNDASSINRPRASLAALQKLGPESPYIGGSIMYWDIVTGSLHQLGKYHEELAAAKKAQRFHPDRIAAMGFEIRALAALKRVPALLSRLEAVVVFTREAARNVDQPDLIGITPASIMINAARELRAHENEKAALAALEQAIDWHRARPAEEARRPERRTELGNALYLARQWDAARLVFQQLTTEDPDNLICIGFLGAIAARRHDRGTAQRMMAILEERKRSQPRPNMQASYWQAKIAAVLEDRKSAVQHLVDLLGEPGRYVHADLDLELLAGYPPFEELRKPKD